jgi:hypothetical protein
MLRRLVNEAMRGDKNAIKLVLSLADRFADSAQSVVNMNELTAEDRAARPADVRDLSLRSGFRRKPGPRYDCEPMVLDALIWIRNKVSIRR